MKILFISYAFPPIKTMASYRNYLIAKGLKDSGNEIFVLSSANKKYFPSQPENLQGIAVDYLPTLDYRSLRTKTSASGTSKKGNRLKQLIRKIKNSWPFLLFFDLGGVLFIISGIIKGHQLIKKEKCDLIISHYPQMSNLIVANWLKRLNPSLKWICDFHHIYVDRDTLNVILPNYQQNWLKKLLKNCNHVITVSEGLFPGLKYLEKPISEVELGFSMNIKETSFSKEFFTISYCGSIYESQELNILLRALAALVSSKLINPSKIKIIYAGANFEKWQSKIKSHEITHLLNNENLGLLPREEINEILTRSNINLLLSWNTKSLKTIIPGKYYDYIAVKKPILLILNGTIDLGWEQRFGDLNPGLICYEDERSTAVENFILKEYENWEKDISSNNYFNKEALKNLTTDNQVKKLSKIIQELIK